MSANNYLLLDTKKHILKVCDADTEKCETLCTEKSTEEVLTKAEEYMEENEVEYGLYLE